MALSIINLMISCVVIFIGTEILVNSSVALSNKLKIPRVVVGTLIVSLATSLPELFVSLNTDKEINFFKKRVNKLKMINLRSKFNLFAFHLSNPLIIFFRNIFLKRLVKNKKFLEYYLGRIYKT